VKKKIGRRAAHYIRSPAKQKVYIAHPFPVCASLPELASGLRVVLSALPAVAAGRQQLLMLLLFKSGHGQRRQKSQCVEKWPAWDKSARLGKGLTG